MTTIKNGCELASYKLAKFISPVTHQSPKWISNRILKANFPALITYRKQEHHYLWMLSDLLSAVG